MKTWDKKNIVIAALILLLLGIVALYLYGNTLAILFDEWKSRVSHTEYDAFEASPSAKDVAGHYGHPEAAAIADAAYGCDGLYFYGDTGYLLKGDLLDQSAASAYTSLPDTIIRIRYGAPLQQMNEKKVAFYDRKAGFAPLGDVGDNQALTAYLKLAEQGKVAYLRLLPNSQNNLQLEDRCDFRTKYGDIFNPDIAWQRDIPLALKDVLSTYFNSEEGSKFAFAADRRNIGKVAVPGTFTGSNQYTGKPNDELAIILTNKDNSGPDRERILVLGYDDINHRGYILYNEVFYHTKLLITTYRDADQLPGEASALASHVGATYQVIQVKTDGDARFYLHYEKEFDTMGRKGFGAAEIDD